MIAPNSVPQIAWRPLAIVAGVTGTVLLVFSGRYGYHRDELYYIVAGRHPAWGYDDQPPLLPFLARVTDEVSGGSLVALRFPAVIVVTATVLLVGLLTRELGGDRKAQVLAAICWATAPLTIIGGHLLSTTPFDILCWTTLAWLVARWVRTQDDRLLLALGPVAGIGLLAKSLPVIFMTALALALLIVGPRQVFRKPQLWIAAAIALALWAPNLWWQATHGWPQLQMTAVIREDADWGGRVGVLPTQFLIVGPPLAVIWVSGLWRLMRNPEARPYRFLGLTYLLVLALVLVTGGREYYPGGAYPALFASGAIAVTGWLARAANRPRTKGLATMLTFNAVATIALSLPIYPASVFPKTPQAEINYDAGETIGWQELTATVARVYQSLPEQDRKTAVILAGNYGQAGAIAKYGPAHGLPAPYSGHLAFWRWGPPPDTMTGPVILIGRWTADELAPYCGSSAIAARNDNGYGVDNDEQGVPIWVCRDLRQPWSAIWPDLHHLG